ncbi:MAG: lantibiotic dehydratase, partial [Candidatus Eremiobacterota bacterium]
MLYRPFDFVLVRTPLLPIEATGPRTALIPTAMRLGSPALSEGRGRPERRTRAELRYRIRMATRPTPYGLFGCVSLARWGDACTLALADAPPRTRTRLDMEVLWSHVLDRERDPAVQRGLNLWANPAARVRCGRLVLPERMRPSGEGTEPHVSVRATAAALAAMALAAEPVPYSELVDELSRRAPRVPRAKVEGLVAELLEQTLLLSDLRPPMLGDPQRAVLTRLEELRVVAEQARAWDERGGDPPDRVQVDAVAELSGDGLPRAVGLEAARAAAALLRLTPYPSGLGYLAGYHQAFLNRYGQDREVPLLELLDPATGLGPPRQARPVSEASASRNEVLLELAARALRDRLRAVELDSDTLKRLQTWTPSPEEAPLTLDLCCLV